MVEATADIVVIGAGVMGSAAGRELARRGAKVLVLERSIPGAEASSAAAGILGAQAEADSPGPLFDLFRRSRELYGPFACELEGQTGIRTGYAKCGVLLLAFEEKEQEYLIRKASWQKEKGLAVDLLRRSDLPALGVPLSEKAVGGLLLPDDGQVEPPLLAKALARGAELAGAKFLRASIEKILVENGKAAGVQTSEGKVSCGKILVAAGAWTALVAGTGLPPSAVRPVRGQVVQFEGKAGLFKQILIRHGHGYLVPRPDGRVVAGSTMEEAGFEKAVTVAGLHKILTLAETLVPALGAARFQDAWSNFRPTTPDHLPLLGEGPVPGVFFASGHHRNGILLIPATAELAADLLTGKPPALDPAPFSPRRLADGK
ncbi:MAG: glycine oxidase ThiO [Bdellovibrionota bacterium]